MPNKLSPDDWKYADNPIGTETTYSMGPPSAAPMDDVVGQWPTGLPMTRSQYDGIKNGSIDLFNQLSLAYGYRAPSMGPNQLSAASTRKGSLPPPPPRPTPVGAGAPAATAEGLGDIGMIKAYHGSPHSFGEFNMSKIGTGEGAQAYGHGLYFAGNEGTARGYRDTLSPLNVTAGGVPVKELNPPKTVAMELPYIGQPGAPASFGEWADRLSNSVGHFENEARGVLRDRHATAGDKTYAVNRLKEINDSVAWLRAHADQPISFKRDGHMYEVNINAKPNNLLDWDKPLEKQDVGSRLLGKDGAVENFRNDPYISKFLDPHVNGDYAGITGKEFHSVLTRLGRDDMLPINGPGVKEALYNGLYPQAASNFLRNEGIPGIKYLDQGSRKAGTGTSNYVMFDDKLIDILRKYGVAGMLGGGAAVNKLSGAPE